MLLQRRELSPTPALLERRAYSTEATVLETAPCQRKKH